ncbi:MAG: histidine--tRNA ligase [Alphaproteobacteria bacterium]|nr:histidine--tRNA ligase [Alphaproteobacteria bacterium]
MSEKKKIYKPSPISGFPEWTPDVRLVEQQWLDHIRRVFESYGYCNIETPAIEALDVIAAKGEDVDKEIYVLERLQADENDKKEARLALHFDQTVPLARYVAQHFNDLIFPFKRYQMQKVWRGERPQAGRFREFYQCDIDVINVDHLPLHFDAEMPAIIWQILSTLSGMKNEKIQLRISNRKILMGAMQALEIKNPVEVMRWIDKAEKLSEKQIFDGLLSANVEKNSIRPLLTFCEKKETGPQAGLNIYNHINSYSFCNDLMREGAEELMFVMDQLALLPANAAVADLSIVRGLDYYTGTVYETVFLDDPSYGSICSGGRYDDLAGNYINKHLPGVGISIGFSRLFDRIRQKGQLPLGKHSPADILVVMPNEDMRGVATETANILRQRYNVELSHGGKLKKQLATAEKKGIPYIWFPPFEDGLPHEVKNLATGEQTKADPNTWEASLRGTS